MAEPTVTARKAHPRTPTRGRQPTRSRKHAFVESSDTWLAGHCDTCNLRGQPGDRHHLTDDEIQAQRQYEQRKLGEADE